MRTGSRIISITGSHVFQWRAVRSDLSASEHRIVLVENNITTAVQ